MTNPTKYDTWAFSFQEETLRELETATSELDDKTKMAVYVLRDKVQNALFELAKILNEEE